MRAMLVACLAISSTIACGGKSGADDDDGDGGGTPDACVGIECNVVDCGAMSLPPTSISGTVFAPNGTLPLNGVNVYVPRDPLPPFVEGATCDRCESSLPGSPVVQTTSDAAGNFRLDNVPAGADIPLVITTGKWRRQITIPSVSQCSDNTVGAAETRLPATKAEGDIPKIAITTGDADSMECLARKLGIADAEITNNAGSGRIHLYAGNGVNRFNGGFAGGAGQNLSGAGPFWSSVDSLKAYDIVILSCEGSQLGGTNKLQGDLDAMKAYADLGGRVFASHWHNIWISGKFQGGIGAPTPVVWSTVGTWQDTGSFDGLEAIDEVSNPKGPQFADWMLNVQGSTVRGEFPVTQGRLTSQTIDTARVEQWVTRKDGNMNPQMFQFTTPNEVASDQRCGKVVFTDMHVSGSRQGGDYPDSCVGGAGNLALTPQEKALAFMFFDIAGCVGGIF
jgi:hypothetical protein